MKIAISGATGQLGRHVVNILKSRISADNIVALVRTPDKAADLGVTARAADYSKPDTLESALSGVETLLLISSNEIGQRSAQHRNVIDAAKKANVQWIVYTSLLHADTSAIKALSGEHLDTEAALKASGLPYTILRNGWYSENYTASVPGAIASGAFLGCADGAKISSAARADYAEAAVAVLTGEGHKGKTYELAGDKAYTLSELAAEISRQTGKDIPYKNHSEAEYAESLVGFGLPAPLAQAFAGFDTGAAQGALFDDGHQLSKLIGHPTTPIATSIADVLKAQGVSA
jgi:NAD(P)H dehydrogenase (quinone)